MASINKVMLIGVLGKDPDVRAMPNGDYVANISMATTETWRDSIGDKQERTEWHKVVFYRKLAEVVGKWLHKGSKIYIEGKLETRTWEKDGVKHYTTSINANEMKMLSDVKPREVKDNRLPPAQAGFGDMDDGTPY